MIGSPELLAGNLQALADALGCQVRLPDVADHIAIEPGPPATVLVRDPSGGRLLVHSRRDPLAEAARALAAGVGDRAPSTLVVVGAGLGYLPEVAARRFPDARVLVIEPEPAFARLMLSRRDWRPQLASGRLLVLTGPGYEGASAAWRMVTEEEGPLTIVHPVLARAAPQAMADGRATVDRIWFGARANADAKRRLEAPYLLNTLRNLPVLAREGNAAALDGRFLNQPAVIVAAGPSLDRQLEDLKAIEDHALIVAVDTAARPLMAAGIQPHLVVAVDPSEANAAHLEGLPAGPGTWLVAETSLHPTAFAPFAGRTFCFRVAAHHPWPWLHAAGFDVGLLRAWGSVLTTAFDLALRMGSSPIVFAGADLAYTGNRPYCRGTTYELEWTMAAARGDSLSDTWARTMGALAVGPHPGLDGGPVVTADRLVAFRNWIVEAASQHPERRIVNSSGHGILHGGRIEVAPLLAAVGPSNEAMDRDVLADLWRASASNRTEAAAGALARLRQGADPMTVKAWRSIADTAAADLERALADTSAALRTGPRAMADHGPIDSVIAPRLPEGMARFRQFMLEGATEGEQDDAVDAGLPRAARALGKIVALTDSLPPVVGPAAGAPVEPLAARTDWPPAIGASLARCGGELGRALARGRRVERPHDVLARFPDRPWADGPLPRASRVRPELGAMAGMMEWAEVAAATTDHADPADARLIADVGCAVRRQLAGETADHLDAVRCTVTIETDPDAPPVTASTSVRLRDLMRSLTGRIVETGEPGELPGARFLRASRAVPPVVLEHHLPRCLFATTLNGREALLGGLFTEHGYAVGENGAVRLASTWPRRIIGEVPWGQDGGALAWCNDEGDSALLLRPAAGVPAEIHPLPFRPTLPLPRPDGSVLWSSYFGGLWSWHPQQGTRLLANAPPAIGIRAHGNGVRLDPATKGDAGHTVNVIKREALLWRPGATSLQPLPLGPAGLSWSQSERQGWTAEAHPHADLVAITSPAGRHFHLACVSPFSVAWAGQSLVVVSTTAGMVIRFPWLRSALEGPL